MVDLFFFFFDILFVYFFLYIYIYLNILTVWVPLESNIVGSVLKSLTCNS